MPGNPLLVADQLRFLCVFMLVSCAEQIQPWICVKPLKVQPVFALNFNGLTTKTVFTGGHCHCTGILLRGPVKMRVALAGQAVSGIKAFTAAEWPGSKVPTDG